MVKDALIRSRALRRTFIILTLLAFWLIPLTAFAHKEVTVGSYVFEIGWVNEPVIVGERNSLYLLITAADEQNPTEATGEHSHNEGTGEHDHAENTGESGQVTGVTGAEATLEFAVEYGSVRQTYDLRPVVGQPGQYTADLLPTREGQYTFHFSGALNGEAIDLKFEPEEVEPIGKLAFPELPTSSTDLAARLAAVQDQARTTQMIAIGSLVLGLIGTGLGIYGIIKK
jgi:hypothetical protein